MADNLKIEIDVASAKKALDSLSASFGTFKQVANTSVNGASQAVTKLNAAMASLKAVNPAVLDSLKQFNIALANLNTSNLTNLQAALSGLSLPPGIQNLPNVLKAAGQSAQQANAHVLAYQKAQQQAAAAAQQLAAASQKALNNQLASQARNTANSINQLSDELLNASGFMAGIGVTAGKIAVALKQLSDSGVGLSAVFAGMQARVGTFGAIAAGATAAVVAVKALYSSASAILAPILEVGTAFQNFNIALDAIQETSGAGRQAMEGLQKIASTTGQDILVLSKNFQGFAAATKTAGLSASQTMKIYEDFSTGFAGLNLSAQQVDKAFNALTQMFSKGKVQAEELRGQLGDALPGAFGYAAEAAGVTTAALDGMLRAGTVVATELIPKFGELLRSKFGDDVAKQVGSASGQLRLFGTLWTNLLNTMSQGFAGGVLGGLAAGFYELNKAMDSATIRAFAAAIGDFLGLVSGTVLSTLAGFVNGLTMVTDVFFSFAEGVGKILSPIGEFISALTGGNSVMQSVATVAQTLGTALGLLASYYVATTGAAKLYNAVLIAFSPAAQVAQAAMASYGVSIGNVGTAYAASRAQGQGFLASLTSAATSVVTFTKANNTLNQNLRGTGAGFIASGQNAAAYATSLTTATSWSARALGAVNALKVGLLSLGKATLVGAAITVVVGILGQLIPYLERAAKTAFDYGKALVGAKTEVDSFKSSNELVQQVLKTFNETAQKTPEAIFKSAVAFRSFAGAQAEASSELDALDERIEAANRALQDHNRESEDSVRAMEDRRKGIEREKQAWEDYVQDQEKLNKTYFDRSRQIKNAKEEITALDRVLDSSKANIDDVKSRNENYKSSLEDTKISLERTRDSLKEWGIVLDGNSQALARQFVQFGETKEAAAQYAYGNQLLTESEQEREAAIDKQIAKAEEYLTFSKKFADAQKENYDKLRKGLEDQGLNTEQIDQILAAEKASVESSQQLAAANAAKTASLLFYSAVVDDKMSVEEALVAVQNRLGGSYDVNANKLKVMSGYARDASGNSGELATAQEKAQASSKTWSDVLKGIADRIFSAGDKATTTAASVQKVSTAFENTKTTLDGAKSTLESIATSYTTVQTNVDALSTSLPNVTTAMGTFVTLVSDNAEALTTFTTGLEKIRTQADSLVSTMPIIATGFTSLYESIPGIAEPLSIVATSFERIAVLGSDIDTTSTSMVRMIEKLVGMQKNLSDVTKSVGEFGKAFKGVGDGYDAAINSGEDFERALDSVESSIASVIAEMERLKTAAEEALAAANAARSGNTDSNLTTNTNREGGYSDVNSRQRQTVALSSFDNAPHFAEGTTNTSKFLSKVAGGGIPSILHPNEAVIPLSRGRKVPVDLSVAVNQPPAERAPMNQDMSAFRSVSAGLTDVVGGMYAVVDALTTLPQAMPQLDKLTPTVNIKLPPQAPSMKDMNQPRMDMPVQSSNGLEPQSVVAAQKKSEGDFSSAPKNENTAPINITINVNANDLDGFRRSEDQIVRSLSDKIRRANRRNG
ncbi:MAG: tape measure protein [Betaproteobacteria bacterium]